MLMTPTLPRRPRWRSLTLLALCLAPLLWPLEHLAERYYRSELAGQNRQTLDLYVANLLGGSAAALQYLLPVIIFLVAVFLAFATGTSWGTFSILIPIVCHAFPQGEMLVVSIAACLSGAVCGDHCSPISDTTIMASAGAHCSHVNHVSTQLPYAITAAACSAVCYIITGLAQAVLGSRASLVTSLVLLVVAIVLELAVLGVIRARTRAKTSGDAV